MAEENHEGVGLPAGTQIGKYTIVSRIRIGGQAVLYKAHEPMLDRDVAIKQISSHLAEDATFLQRFRNEARVLARLGAEQPAIVTIHELIEDPRGLFIIMEYVSGRTLEQVLEEQPDGMDVKAALQIIWRLAAALHTVHAAGIIHRDIKPANIFVGEGLRVKLADFGVAARKSGNTSMLLGTTKYMAPELLGGGVNDDRVDMYSLGFVAYEMLAGRRRFDEVFSDVVRDKHAESLRWMKWHGSAGVTAPPLNEVNPAVPPVLAQIVAGMMAKDPAKRFESMEALGRAIKSKFSPRARVEPVGSVASDMHEDEASEPPVPAGTAAPAAAAAAEPSQGPATAVLPRKPMSLKTKLIIGGSVFGIVIIAAIFLAVRGEVRDQGLKARAEKTYEQAGKAYLDRDYATALENYEKVRMNYAGKPLAAQAAFFTHLCKGYLAVGRLQFDQAAASEDAAKEELNRTQIAFPELTAWTRDRREMADLYGLRMAAKKFREQLAKSKRLLEEGKYDEARLQMDAMGEDKNRISENAKLLEEFNQHYAAIALAKFRHDFNATLDQGRGLANKGESDKAKKVYEDAIAMLDSKAADVLPPGERDEAKKNIQKKVRDLTSTLEIKDLEEAIRQARKEGDKDAEMAQLRKAVVLTKSDVYAKRITELETEIDLDRATKLIASANESEAIKVLQALVARDSENGKAQGLLKGLLNRRQLQTTRRAADSLFDKGDWAAAMDKYKEAIALQPDAYLAGRVTDCRFNIQYAQAEDLEKADKLQQAIDAYNKAKAIKSDRDVIIDTRQKAMRRELDYRSAMREGDVSLAAQDWNAALASFDKAKRLKNSPEVNARITKTKYDRFISMGDDAMGKRDFKGALANYKLAKNVMDTPDVKEKVAHAQAMVDAAEEKPAP